MDSNEAKSAEVAPVATLAAGILHDTQRLIEQQVALARLQFFQDWGSFKPFALWLGAAIVSLVSAGLLLSLTLVFVLHESSGLPLWACFGIILIGYLTAGGVSLHFAREKSKEMSFVNE